MQSTISLKMQGLAHRSASVGFGGVFWLPHFARGRMLVIRDVIFVDDLIFVFVVKVLRFFAFYGIINHHFSSKE